MNRDGNHKSHLLVSVRSAAEARSALIAGADVIDIKEPSAGSLGRAADETIAEVIRVVAGRRPVSVALGELAARSRCIPRMDLPAIQGLTYAKWGLAGMGGRPRWQEEVLEIIAHSQQAHPGCRPVVVAYADWQRAHAPPVDLIRQLACDFHLGHLLIDTLDKDGTTLLDWLNLATITEICNQCRQASVRVALAGCLDLEQIAFLRPIQPDWFAVRGAVCKDRRRDAVIDPDRVRRLVDFLRL